MKKLGCALLVILAFFAGMKWVERSCVKEKRAQLVVVSAEFQKELVSRKKAETMAKVIAVENELLRAENASFETRLKDCKPVPETKRVVPRKKKPRAAVCKKKVVSTPKAKALTPSKVVAPTPPVLQEAKELCSGGEMKVVAGKWQCVKEEPKSLVEAPPVAVAQPEISSFAKAVDEEIGVQAATPMGNVAVQVPLQPYCPAYIDSNGMTVHEGYRRVPGGGMVRCK